MMKSEYLTTILLALIVMFVPTSCSKDDDDDEPTNSEQTEFNSSLANDATVAYSAAQLSMLPDEFAAALAKRMPLSAAADEARVLVLKDADLEANTVQVLDTYMHNGVIVIVEPNVATVNAWLEKVNLARRMPENAPIMAMYAFGGSSSYLLDELPEGLEVNEVLNEFVEWVNTVLQPKVSSDGETAVSDISNAQTVMHTYSYSCRYQVSKAFLSSPDYVYGKGTVTAVYSVYPLFSFPESGDAGEDFYVVEAEYRVESYNMTNRDKPQHLDGDNWWPDEHMWIARHGDFYSRICALYLTNYSVETEMLKPGQSSCEQVDGLIFACTPVPGTSVGSSKYTVKSTWSLASSQGLSGAPKSGLEYSSSYTGGVGYSYSCQRNVEDVLIGNNQTSSVVKFTYDVQNLPKYEDNSDIISIRKAPPIALGTAKFPAQWVWRVPGTKVGSTNRFLLHSRLKVQYGAFHYWTNLEYVHDVYEPLGDGVEFLEDLTPPNRTPTGSLQIENTTSDEWITEVTVLPMDSDKPVYQQLSGSTAPGSSFSCVLPAGQYRVTMKMSKRGEEKKLYELRAGSVNISFAASTNLQSDYSFKEKTGS